MHLLDLLSLGNQGLSQNSQERSNSGTFFVLNFQIEFLPYDIKIWTFDRAICYCQVLTPYFFNCKFIRKSENLA